MKHSRILSTIGSLLFVASAIAILCQDCVVDRCTQYKSAVSNEWDACGAEDDVPNSQYCRDTQKQLWNCKSGPQGYKTQTVDRYLMDCVPVDIACQ